MENNPEKLYTQERLDIIDNCDKTEKELNIPKSELDALNYDDIKEYNDIMEFTNNKNNKKISIDDLSKISKEKKNQKTMQVEFRDTDTGDVYFAEYIFKPKYTRYMLCKMMQQEIVDEEINMEFFEKFADDDDLESAWTFDIESTGLDNNVAEEVNDDPNDPLQEDYDNTDVVYVVNSDIDQTKIIVEKEGHYNNDYYLQGAGNIIYDECTLNYEDDDGLGMYKYIVGNEDVFMDFDDKLNYVTMYKSTLGCKLINNDMVQNANGLNLEYTYTNNKGDTLREILNFKGELLQQVFENKQKNIYISIKFKARYTNMSKNDVFDGTLKSCNNLFPIDYTEIRLKVGNKSQRQKNKYFKNKQVRGCLHLPNIQFFKEKLNMDYVDKSDYRIVNDYYELKDICEYLESDEVKDRVIAYDAETQGLNFHEWSDKPDKLVTHSLSWKNHQSIIVPVRMKYCKNIPPDKATELLKPILENHKILAHNGSADARFLFTEGINLNLVEDTMHLIKHLVPFIAHREVIGFGRAIDDLIIKAFGVDMIDLHKYVFAPDGVEFDFSLLNEDYMIYYGCPDTDLMRMLWKGLRGKLPLSAELAYRNTVKFSKEVALNSTYAGLGVNTRHIEEERSVAVATTKKIEELIYTLTGESQKTLSLTSSQQKSNYIFGKMGAPIEYARRTQDGKLSADKVVVERLSKLKLDQSSDIFKEDILDVENNIIVTKDELNRLKYPVCRLLRVFSDLDKNITSFYNGLLNNSESGVYYPDFRIGVTDTWRTTERIQITKKGIKSEIGPYNDKWGWCSTDYAAEEFRLAVNGSEDYDLMRMLTDPEADPHTMVASELYSIPPYKVSKDLRSKTKSANFGIIYGMKAKRLACSINNVDVPSDEQLADADNLYKLYCYKRAVMLKPLEEAKEHVRKYAWVSNKLGYRMVYHQIIDVNKYLDEVFDFTKPIYSGDNFTKPVIDEERKRKGLGSLLNACGNYPIQSWAGGILMEVYNKLMNELESRNLRQYVRVPLLVHDEIGVCYLKDKVHPYELIEIQNKTMVSRLPYLNKPEVAPLYIGIGFGNSWGTAKSDDYEIPVELQLKMIDEFKSGTCPSIEEINKETAPVHFLRRIKEHIRYKVCELFKDMHENKHYIRQVMKHRLNNNMSLGKKANELFSLNDKVTKEIDIVKYLELIYDTDIGNIEDMGIIYEEGDVIIEENEREIEPDEIQDFFFYPQIHPRLEVVDDIVVLDVRDVYAPIIKNIIIYLNSLCLDEYNIHEKSLALRLNDGLRYLPKKILGMPANFADILDKLLAGAEIQNISRNNNKIQISVTDIPPVTYTKDAVILNTGVIKRIHPDLFNKISQILVQYLSKSPIANIKVIVSDNKQVDTNLRMISISVKMQEQINNLVSSYSVLQQTV